MIRWWCRSLALFEIIVTSMMHILYALSILSMAVALDVSQGISSLFRFKDNAVVESEEQLNSDGPPPILLVHGLFGFGKGMLGGLSYFAGAEKKIERILVPDLGSLTSMHDRACELFYYLKGGRVDYGEEHSRTYGHSRFGRIYEKGHFSEWDEHHPIHLVGHSAGGQIVRVFQQMLADKSFEGHDTNENWVLSITTLSGTLNGSTRTYMDGMQPEDGRSLKPISLLQVLRIAATIYHWLNLSWLRNYYNLGFDHFDWTRQRTGISGLVDCLVGNAGPFATGDWILPELTIQGAMRLNSKIKTYPDTFYFSYASKQTRKIMGITIPSGISGIHPVLLFKVLQMGQWRFPQYIPPPFKGYRDEDWHDNDGALNTISMTHPRIPTEHPSHLVIDDSDFNPLQPGIWYYKMIEADHMLFVVNHERAGVKFDLMYDTIFDRCRKHVFRNPPTLPNQCNQ